MSVGKGKKQTHQPFEGRDPHGQFMKLTMDMLRSEAWQSLCLRQRGLYGELKARYRQKVERGHLVESNIDGITFPKSEWGKLYGNYNTFKADIEVLIDRGFIRIVERGQCSRTPNKYGLIADWQRWKKPK